MLPAIRGQADGREDEFSKLAQTHANREPDMARQEFKKDADINHILKNFGVMPGIQPPTFGSMDFDMDLQLAINTLDAVKEAHAALPDDLREKYPTVNHMLDAAASGELRKALDERKTAADAATRDAALEAALALDIAREQHAKQRAAKRAAERATAGLPDDTPLKP